MTEKTVKVYELLGVSETFLVGLILFFVIIFIAGLIWIFLFRKKK